MAADLRRRRRRGGRGREGELGREIESITNTYKQIIPYLSIGNKMTHYTKDIPTKPPPHVTHMYMYPPFTKS